jgi:hypothetical protein
MGVTGNRSGLLQPIVGVDLNRVSGSELSWSASKLDAGFSDRSTTDISSFVCYRQGRTSSL